RASQNLCLDKGYDNKPGREVVKKYGYRDHTRRIDEEKLNRKGKKRHPARRCVVERTLARLSKCLSLPKLLREMDVYILSLRSRRQNRAWGGARRRRNPRLYSAARYRGLRCDTRALCESLGNDKYPNAGARWFLKVIFQFSNSERRRPAQPL